MSTSVEENDEHRQQLPQPRLLLPAAPLQLWSSSNIISAAALPAVVRYAGLRNELRCYHQIQMPAGLVALGDSAMYLNPIYGQVSKP